MNTILLVKKPKATEFWKLITPFQYYGFTSIWLQIDLKGSFKNEVGEAVENKPVLKETIGSVLRNDNVFANGLTIMKWL